MERPTACRPGATRHGATMFGLFICWSSLAAFIVAWTLWLSSEILELSFCG
jgi:hypothetical protein